MRYYLKCALAWLAVFGFIVLFLILATNAGRQENAYQFGQRCTKMGGVSGNDFAGHYCKIGEKVVMRL
jgi:hypothetical protein